MSYKEAFKIFGDFKTPAFDFPGLIEVQRRAIGRNIEALTAANQIVAEAFQSIARNQADTLKSNIEAVTSHAKEFTTGGTPDISFEKQTNQTKAFLANSLANAREASEIIIKSSFEAFDLLNKRANESLEEWNNTAASEAKAASSKK